MTEDHRRRKIRQKLVQQSETLRRTLATPIGPLPRGAIVELSGPPASGKTTVALAIVAAVQRVKLNAAWIDAEHTFSPALALKFDIATETLPILRPTSAEQALDIARRLTASQGLDLLIVDSAAALVPELELHSGIGEAGPGLQSRVLASGLRRLAGAVARSDACILFLNQTRAGRDDTETTAGGAPLKLYASVRIAVNLVTESRVRVRVLKNKVSAAFKGGEIAMPGDFIVMKSP
jgi:recombination protein RecA